MANGYDPIIGTDPNALKQTSFTLSAIDLSTAAAGPAKKKAQQFDYVFNSVVQLAYDAASKKWSVVLASTRPFITDVESGSTGNVTNAEQLAVKCEPDAAYTGPFPAMIVFAFTVSGRSGTPPQTVSTPGQYVVTRDS